ncbi:MAG: DUF1549 domain-containing protein, partial [Verrucomicrobiales bacterium]|nr:DUF1549 domain-containing protein [Verrucomicrobiales bacterium]
MPSSPPLVPRTRFLGTTLILAATVLSRVAATAWADDGAEPVDFARDVRPILSRHCFKCHGPDAKTRKGGLRLDVRDAAIAPAESGDHAIVPGRPEASELMDRVASTDGDEVMPPPSVKNPITPAQREILRRWIAQGAEYPPHWAFVPTRATRLPAPTRTEPPVSPAANPIDLFVRERLAGVGLEPSPAADPVTLVRRLYLDLIGLSPSPEEVDAYLVDAGPGAYERLVDRLLASPHYGERWARRWMDLARYADTNGYEKDRPRSIWPWRDWLIRALNDDLSFDRFTVEQIAGDMIPGATADQRIATGFHRNTMLNEEGGVDPLEFRFHAMVDRVHTTATTWLGLTMACAQCHTHKYDPIDQKEYYRFMAFLDNADEPTLDVPDPERAAKRREAERKIAELEAELPNRFPVPSEVTFVTPPASAVATESGALAEALPDGSYRFSGALAETDVYTFEFDTPLSRVTSLNLDALADDALPAKGPGRTPHGNFVLSEIEIVARPKEGTSAAAGAPAPVPVAIASASADFSQSGFSVEHAIDGKRETGWAISGEGAWNINRRATFRFARPAGFEGGTRFTVRLRQQHGGRHLLGRVRLGFGTEDRDPGDASERRRERFAKRFAEWGATEADSARAWVPLRPTHATSNVPVLTLEDDATVFVRSDQTKSDTYELAFRSELKGITAIRLEVLPDERLPRQGPGRVYFEGPIGDFFLSAFALRSGDVPVKLGRPSQTYASGGNTAAKALDDDLQSGW